MSVLVKGMKMPKNCEKCLYLSWSNFYQIYVCNAIRHDEPVLFDKKQVKSTATVRSGRADNCPLVSVQPHGRWIKKEILHCSECDMPTMHPWPYCQNCGAKMDGGEIDAID